MAGIRNIAAKLDVSPAAVLLPAALIVLDTTYLLALTVVAALIHELGHFAALKFSRCRVTGVKIGLLGASIKYDGSLSYGGEVLSALSGCMANAAAAMCLAVAGRVFAFEPAYHLAGLCVVLCAFNLLPAYPLDGGRAIYNACAYIFGLNAAQKITFLLRCAVVLTLAAAGFWLLLEPSHNPTLLICALIVALYRT